MDLDKLIENYTVELKRGILTLVVLNKLQEPQYGYSLLEALEASNFPIESGTLYPLLRRLEKQGLLQSEWNTDESRPRKFYELSELGKELYTILIDEWKKQTTQLHAIFEGETA